MTDVKESIESAIAYLTGHPDEVRYTDSVTTATLGDGLRVAVEGSHGTIVTDMPKDVGGRAELASPGWLLCAPVASCVATVIGMEAARVDGPLVRSRSAQRRRALSCGVAPGADLKVRPSRSGERYRLRRQSPSERGLRS